MWTACQSLVVCTHAWGDTPHVSAIASQQTSDGWMSDKCFLSRLVSLNPRAQTLSSLCVCVCVSIFFMKPQKVSAIVFLSVWLHSVTNKVRWDSKITYMRGYHEYSYITFLRTTVFKTFNLIHAILYIYYSRNNCTYCGSESVIWTYLWA